MDPTRRQFLGTAAALSSLPIPREALMADSRDGGSRPDVTIDSVGVGTYVEQYERDGAIRVRAYPGQERRPVEVVVGGGFGEFAVGLSPGEARRLGEVLVRIGGV